MLLLQKENLSLAVLELLCLVLKIVALNRLEVELLPQLMHLQLLLLGNERVLRLGALQPKCKLHR